MRGSDGSEMAWWQQRTAGKHDVVRLRHGERHASWRRVEAAAAEEDEHEYHAARRLHGGVRRTAAAVV